MKKRKLFLTCVMSTLLGIMVMGCSSKQPTGVTEPTEITTSVAESANEEKTETTTAVETEITTEEETETTTEEEAETTTEEEAETMMEEETETTTEEIETTTEEEAETTTEEEKETTTVVETEAPTVVETEAPTVVETEAPTVRVSEDGTYVTKTLNLETLIAVESPVWHTEIVEKPYDINFYALGGNTKYVWEYYSQLQTSDKSAEECAAEYYGISLSDFNFVTRTDFADGLIDNDGNGIDDRDPINGMGFIDLNHNGVDDRQVIMGKYNLYLPYENEDFTENITDSIVHSLYYDFYADLFYNGSSYLCPHNVVCSSANRYHDFVSISSSLPSFYVEKCSVCLDVICPICNSEAYAWKNDVADRLDQDEETYRDKNSEWLGYEIGDVLTCTDGTVVTYQGNDIWINDSGRKYYATWYYPYKCGSYEEFVASRSLYFYY